MARTGSRRELDEECMKIENTRCVSFDLELLNKVKMTRSDERIGTGVQ